MSRLYRLDATAAQIAARFHADPGHDPWAGGCVTPGSFAPVVVMGRNGRRLVPRLWGVPPPPSAALKGGAPVAHVRNLDSPFWIGTLRYTDSRCLVPATAFQLRAPHWASLAAAPLFAFAGIWRDSEVASFAILTCEPNRLVASVNPVTMPVILHAEDHEAWLRGDWKSVRRLVSPFPSQLMRLDDCAPAMPG